MAEFTKGEWLFRPHDPDQLGPTIVVLDPHDQEPWKVCKIIDGCPVDPEYSNKSIGDEGNASLICAAPLMYEALTKLHPFLVTLSQSVTASDFSEALNAARIALSRANDDAPVWKENA